MSSMLAPVFAVLFLLVSQAQAQQASTCHGTTSNGRLENGWTLPSGGNNYKAYSALARHMGRANVHSTVHKIIVSAYSALEKAMPGRVYVYGETGFEEGGQFKPHKTHRNGLSVDFMVPVLHQDGRSVPLPTGVFDKWGYSLEFDKGGRLGKLQIDAESMAEHIYQLHIAARDSGVDLRRVIFDPGLQALLHGTSRWSYLQENVKFSTKRSWVRHDEHYHIDFDVPCESDD